MLQIKYKKLEELKPYFNNPRNNENAVHLVAKSIQDYGFRNPIIIDANNIIVAGHTRYEASKVLGLEEVPTLDCEGLTDEQIQAFRIIDNKTQEFAEWDIEKLNIELESLALKDVDLSAFDLTVNLDDLELENEQEVQEDEFTETTEENARNIKAGDVYILGTHRLMCGDATRCEDVAKLMAGESADMVFTDPPYGMKKEKDGVKNDNLNYDDLLEFNKKWIPISFENLKENGSWYCWGIDEPLMDIYSHILKPMKKNNQITYRNLITWDKGHGQGQLSDEFRCYAPADEKCLFVMLGVQDFNINADHYFEGWEPIRKYLAEQRQICGWDIPTMKTIAGHSDKSRDHWTNKSQWSLLTEDTYNRFQSWAREHNVEAFKRSYNDILREYNTIKIDYDKEKKEYYNSRAYFNNTHDNMNSVWHFERAGKDERETTGGHATPKPLKLCERAIKSSSREDELVLDIFGGSGSTLIACEQLNRRCNMLELSEHYCNVIIDRWENLTGLKARKEENNESNANKEIDIS